MSILCLVIVNWDFLKNFIKVLNIISLILIALIVIINFLLFLKLKNVKYNIIKNYKTQMCLSFFVLLIYLLIIIFNIYNSIYLSKQLHIIDDPEYTGKKNDQNYKDYNENKYLDIPLKQFIIAGFFPSIISVLNILCTIFCIAFRKKMILTYNKMLSTKEDNKNNEVIMYRHKPKHRYSYKGNTRRNSTEKRRKTNEENENIQKELNKIKIRHNSVTMK